MALLGTLDEGRASGLQLSDFRPSADTRPSVATSVLTAAACAQVPIERGLGVLAHGTHDAPSMQDLRSIPRLCGKNLSVKNVVK